MLKILAIILIITFHMTQTLTAYSETAPSYVINLEELSVTNSRQSFILHLFQQFGALGNHIFFVGSAWFLIDARKRYGMKIVTLLAEVWAVSVAILVVVLLTRTVDVNGATILRCIMPSTFSNNWYITNYCLFLVIVPFLNLIIDKLPQKQHLILVLYIAILRVAIEPFAIEWSRSIPSLSVDKWILLYFVIAYMKMYLPRFSTNVKTNCLLLAFGTGVYLLCVAMNTYDLKSNALITILVTGWQVRQFYLYAIAIALFNLFRTINLHSPLVNRISGYSLLIYIIHENLLIRSYYRPMVLSFINRQFGHEHIVYWIILLAILTFLCSLLLSVFADLTIGRITRQIVEKYYSRLKTLCNSAIGKLAEIK